MSQGIVITIAPAAATDLSCEGVMHTYEMKQKEGTVDPGAAVVDLEHKRIATPVGSFRITTISDDSISFDDPNSKQLVVFGTLDRISGLMRVFWRHPEDNSKAAMYAELKCSSAISVSFNGLRRVERRLPQPRDRDHNPQLSASAASPASSARRLDPAGGKAGRTARRRGWAPISRPGSIGRTGGRFSGVQPPPRGFDFRPVRRTEQPQITPPVGYVRFKKWMPNVAIP